MNVKVIAALLNAGMAIHVGAQPGCDGPYQWSDGLPGRNSSPHLTGAIWVGVENPQENQAFTIFGTLRRINGVTGAGLFQFRNGEWHAWPAPISGAIMGAVIFDLDGPGPLPESLIIGGRFGGPENPVSFLARWTGSSWEQATPFPFERIEALELLDEDGPGPDQPTLFASTLLGVAKWVDGAWERRPFTPDQASVILTADLDGPGPEPTRLYAAGRSQIAAWNSGAWAPLPSPGSPMYHMIALRRDGGPSSLVVGTDDSVFVYESDRQPRRIPGIPSGVTVTRVASFDDGTGLAVYALVRTGSQEYDVFRSGDLETFTMLPQRRLAIAEPGMFRSIALRSPEGCESLITRSGNYGGVFAALGPARVEGCLADFNGDGYVDFFDYSDYVAAFAGGDERADFNSDGFVDFFDYAAFVGEFEAGC